MHPPHYDTAPCRGRGPGHRGIYRALDYRRKPPARWQPPRLYMSVLVLIMKFGPCCTLCSVPLGRTSGMSSTTWLCADRAGRGYFRLWEERHGSAYGYKRGIPGQALITDSTLPPRNFRNVTLLYCAHVSAAAAWEFFLNINTT